jgi:hypothetical protein
MALPRIPIRTEDVTLSDGSTVTVQALSRGEAFKMQALAPDEAAQERFSLAAGTATDQAVADAWYDVTPSGDVTTVLKAVMRLSGIGDGNDPKAS